MKQQDMRFNPRLATYLLLAALVFLGCCASLNRGRWEIVNSNSIAHAASLSSIVFNDQGEGWALTWADLVKLTDNGKTWTSVITNTNSDRAFYSFSFPTTKIGFVVGTQKKGDGYTVLILGTSDGGKSWQEKPTNVKGGADFHKRPALQGISFCGEHDGWAVGEGLILHTTDGGQTWQLQQSDVKGDQRLFAVACTSSTRAWAVGTDGLVLRTSDRGNTWTHQEVGSNDVLMRVRFFGDSGWIVGGTNGKPVLLRTHDGGDTWQNQQPNAAAGLFDIFFLGNRGWIAGERGTLLESDDGGQTWASQRVPTTENLTCLFFLSPKQGWAGGDRLTLLRFSE
jgi:photosystem II stability/assembly factor-like uncharacterized protein